MKLAMPSPPHTVISGSGHCELPRLPKLKLPTGRVRLNVVLLMQPSLEAELQLVFSVNFRENFCELARVLPLHGSCRKDPVPMVV